MELLINGVGKEVVVLIMAIYLAYYTTLGFGVLMSEGMILRRYYAFLIYHWIIWRKKKDHWKRKLLKPLGLCLTCSSGWITIIVSLFFMIYFKTVLTLFSVFIVIYYIDKHEQNNINRNDISK